MFLNVKIKNNTGDIVLDIYALRAHNINMLLLAENMR
jgi:hypothetical protein